MLEGIPGTAHTLPLLIFHGILHKKLHIHLTGWELFVHVEMALQPGSLCKPSLFFNSKVLFIGVENNILHNLCGQPAHYWCGHLSSVPLCQSRCAADFGRSVLARCGMFQTVQAVSPLGYVRGSKRELSPVCREHHALADHPFRFPERDFSDHM